MSSRQYFTNTKCQGNGYVRLPFVLQGHGTGAATVGEGDARGSYVTVARTATGKYSITTTDKYNAVVGFNSHLSMATAAGRSVVTALPTTNADGTLTVGVVILASSTPTDIAEGDSLFCELVLRNSSVLP